MSQPSNIAVLLFCLITQVLMNFAHGYCSGYTSPMSSSAISGDIKSPKYPGNYRDHENCKWMLKYKFDHRDYIAFFNVSDYQLSYKRFGTNSYKCTGYMSIYKAKTDCQIQKPFCNVYYVSDDCGKVASEQFSNCNIFKRRTLIPTEVDFNSEPYYPDRTPQRGFKLQYEFVDCRKVLKTTAAPTTSEVTTTVEPTTTTVTTTTTTTTTSTTTTTIKTTPTTTTPTTTTSATTSALHTTAAETTIKVPTESTWKRGYVTYSTTKEPTTNSEKGGTTAQAYPEGPQKQVYLRNSATTSKTGEEMTTKHSGCRNECAEQQPVESSSSLGWIAAPIIVGILLLLVVLYIAVARRRRKQQSEDIGYLMGIENPHYKGLILKDNKATCAAGL